jgi:hypothetical protein
LPWRKARSFSSRNQWRLTFRGYRRAARAACPPGQGPPRFVRYPSPAAAPRQAARAATLLLSGVRRVAFARRRALPCPGCYLTSSLTPSANARPATTASASLHRKRAASRPGNPWARAKRASFPCDSLTTPLPLSYGARVSATAKPDSTPEARQAMLFICAQSAHLPCQRSDVSGPAGADELRYRCLTVNPLRGGGAGQPNSSFAHSAFQIICNASSDYCA